MNIEQTNDSREWIIDLEGLWIHHYFDALPDRYYRIIKRSMDIIISGIALILTFPLMILIAMLIKLDSRGRVIFRQQRIGQNRRRSRNGKDFLNNRRNGHNYKGKPIYIYKFRTMKNGVKSYASKPKDAVDGRLTRIGKFLRATCLDELPQLVNVLRGEMSIVGPRPEMPYIVQDYNYVESMRLLAKPGLTGLWQLYGSRSKHIHENLHFDLDYIRQRSLRLDLSIMLKTLGYMIRSKNI
jgi:lipopolysaccharide/colanic/teichoic acid biosynthesis glycosyltransferase